MFWLTKILWLLVLPSNVLLWLLLSAVLLTVIGRRRGALWCLIPAVAVSLAVTLLPVGAWLHQPLENRFERRDISVLGRLDGIVVLGGAIDPVLTLVRRQTALNASAERITTMIALARAYPSTRIVFTGGSGNPFGQIGREADAVPSLLRSLGTDIPNLVVERESRNTAENARLAFRLAKPKTGERWLLVTSAAHMPRAVGAFRRAGWPVIPFPVDYRTEGSWRWRGPFSLSRGLESLDAAAKEWIGLIAYRILGHTGNLLPGPKDDR